jgi:hypothetical protein
MFICHKQDGPYKSAKQSRIEELLRETYGFKRITDDECSRVKNIIRHTTNDEKETFCKNKNQEGMMVATLFTHMNNSETVLILTTKENIEEVESGDDIRVVLTFRIFENYENFDEVLDDINEIKITTLCSNQVSKRGGGSILLRTFIDACRDIRIEKIHLTALRNAVGFYRKYGFENADESEMYYRIAGKRKEKVKLVLNLRRGSKKSKNRRKKLSKKSKTKKR